MNESADMKVTAFFRNAFLRTFFNIDPVEQHKYFV